MNAQNTTVSTVSTGTGKKKLYAIGEMPPLGWVPDKMHAALIRPERYGEPVDSFKIEAVNVPEVGPHQVLVWVMAAGTNYNNVWAAMGKPLDIIAKRQGQEQGSPEADGFHIGGSDGSGIVWAVGAQVENVRVGDRVVLSCGMLNPSRIWGYEENWGSFAQFALVDWYQCHPKPAHLSWEEAAAYMLTGATAYRMLFGWPPNTVNPGDPVLIWGGSGGLGAMALQLVRWAGGLPVAVVSDMSKADFCRQFGAVGVIDRKQFSHWGRLPDIDDIQASNEWLQSARRFGKAIFESLGVKKSPKIVLEHPGESTLPTSMYVCDEYGMVVICGGTSGYNGDLDIRYLWMRQKRLQGSHFASVEECAAFNDLIREKAIEPALSRVFRFDEVGLSHQLMRENRHPPGNMAILVNAQQPGMVDIHG